MSLPHRLRRYLRAFLGNPSLADEAMLDALERMVAGRERITTAAAFRAAHRVAMRMTPTRPTGGEPMRTALAALPAGARAAFLLLRLEHFTAEAAADVMDLSAERVREEAKSAASQIQAMLVPVGGTALITDPDQLTALDLANIAADLGFTAIREPDPTAATLQGKPQPILIICEAVRRDRGDAATPVANLAERFDAAVLCVTASARADEFIGRVPGARLLRKPFESATAARSMLDAMAEHRTLRLAGGLQGEDEPPAAAR